MKKRYIVAMTRIRYSGQAEDGRYISEIHHTDDPARFWRKMERENWPEGGGWYAYCPHLYIIDRKTGRIYDSLQWFDHDVDAMGKTEAIIDYLAAAMKY